MFRGQSFACRSTLPALLLASVAAAPLWAQQADEPVYERFDDPLPKPEELEESNAVIGEVYIDTENVFDLNNPLEDRLLYRWANALHIVTKPHVIRNQLLFVEGDKYSKQVTDESERILRENRYLHDATIEPISFEDGVVDLRVHTKDVWTLTPSISAGRAGGENRFGIGVKEQNLFGTGVLLGFKVKRTVDRDTATIDYSDRYFRGSRYRLAARIGENSDGHDYRLFYGKPFYALDTRESGGISLLSQERIDPLYERGEIVSEFNHDFEHHEAFIGRSGGLKGNWARRLFGGVVYDDHVFGAVDTTVSAELVPPDRRFIYPYLGFEWVENHFEEGVNFDQISRVEDRFLGMRLSLRLGYSSVGAGSSKDAWHYRGGFSNALVTTKRASIVVAGNLDGRYHDGDLQNARLDAGIRVHRRLTEGQLLYASLSGAVSHNLDLDNQLLLGGDNGLRGYPLRYQGGDSLALLTVEHRIFTEWYPFRLFNVGGAIFFDAGRTWGENPVGGPNLGLLKDVGFGLRIGNNRSGEGRVLHVDIAFPLDGEDTIDRVQILIDAKTSF